MAVLTGEFLCPECQEKLRIHERGKKSIEILCPECGTPIRIETTSDRKLSAHKHDASGTDVADEDSPAWTNQKSASSNRPLYFAGGVIVCGLLLFGGWKLSSNTTKPQEPDPKDSLVNPVAEQVKPIENVEQSEQAPEKNHSEEESPFARNLKLLAQQIDVYQQQNGQFPPAYWTPQGNSATAEVERFSWLAGLDSALKENGSLLPQWNLAWRDPLNDRFVRRRRTELLNPAIRLQASSDRYPASHIVGIAGVGHDAPHLPVSNPRAGIFGWNRSTRVEDVTDGLSNTMLAAGVTGKLSSWADGAASIRPLVQEPYVNGPDGFGSGQSDGMHVLMADGSVRFLSKKTEPTIIRRMAAIADSLPLDASVPGDPGNKNIVIAADPKPETPKLPAEKNQPEMPVSKPETPDPKPAIPQIDFEKALARTVLQFLLEEPAELETVLIELEAMVGIRIEFDPQQIPKTDPIRKQKVSFSKRNVSFKVLLTELIKPAALKFEIRKDHIAIVKQK
ncbi:MAG: DUF1559 domain-containing protein [Planctomycetaceae bacterium]|nr:DUF1559 domain-containing protein [Planctomycetaceae bacterium]